MTARILLAGGGTGGHIYPNVAIAEHVRERRPDVEICFLVSARPGDARILEPLGHELATSPVQPLPSLSRPWKLPGFVMTWRRAVAEARRLIEERGIGAVVATGGFVSGPAIVAATRLGRPRALINLDAIPGKANRRLARYQPALYSVYDTPLLAGAQRVGLPLRRASVGQLDAPAARAALGLELDVPVLFVTGATHGAESLIRALMALAASSAHAELFAGWQVLHQCGTFDARALQEAYDRAGVRARVIAYCDQMGNAWRAATLAVSRAGAGSVAEAWANATPTIFLPNPYHRDQHQRHNARPLVEAGGALLVEDRVDPAATMDGLGRELARLMRDPDALAAMRERLAATAPESGAAVLADWIAGVLPASQ